MIQWALRYRQLGLSVIPIQPKGKEPLIKWTEFQKRIACENEIREWWGKWPQANIAIVTGAVSGIAIVDLDGIEGLESAKKHCLTSPIMSISGSGKHLWYRHPSVNVSNAVRIQPGIDVRGDAGYVLVAPSVHPNGKRYRWLGNVLTAYQLKVLPILPDCFVVSCAEAANSIVKKKDGWIAKALEEMKIGNIDNTLTSICGRLRHDGYGVSDAITLLTPHARQAGAVDGHLEEKVKNIWQRYPASVIIENEQSESVEEFLKEEEPIEWLIPNVIAKKSIAFCVGLPESAKTWIMMDLAIASASGTEWMGMHGSTNARVLFIEQERFRAETKRRFAALLSAKGLRHSDMDSLFIKCGSSIKIDLENSYSAFVRVLEKIRPDLVIIDSLATIHTKEENSRTEIQIVMEKFKTLRQQFGCAFLFISHSNKFAFQAAKEGTEPDVSLMAGSIALPAAAETVFMVTKAKGGGSTVHHIKSTLGPKIQPFGVVVEDVENGIVVRGIK